MFTARIDCALLIYDAIFLCPFYLWGDFTVCQHRPDLNALIRIICYLFMANLHSIRNLFFFYFYNIKIIKSKHEKRTSQHLIISDSNSAYFLFRLKKTLFGVFGNIPMIISVFHFSNFSFRTNVFIASGRTFLIAPSPPQYAKFFSSLVLISERFEEIREFRLAFITRAKISARAERVFHCVGGNTLCVCVTREFIYKWKWV